MLSETEVRDIRARCFPQLAGCRYFAHCRIAAPPAAAVQAARDFTDRQALRTGELVFSPAEEDCLREAARLLGAEEAEIGFLRSTSEGAGAFAVALGLAAGDEVVLNDLEFMSNLIPWQYLKRERGIEVRIARHREGRVLPQDIAAELTPRTRLVAISSVQEVNGFRCDLEAIGALAHRAGALLLVDAIQHLGALRLEARRAGADILIAGGQKWLLAPFGAGLYFIRRELLPRLRLFCPGWRSVRPEDWADLDSPAYSPVREYSFPSDNARRLMVSSIDLSPGIPALLEGLRLINGIGIERIEERILALGDRLLARLRGRVPVASPPEPEHRSAIITFRTGDDGRLVRQLAARGTFVSRAYASGTGGVRVGIHFFNTAEEVDILADQLLQAAGGR